MRKWRLGREDVSSAIEHIWPLLTVDVNAALVQGVRAQLGDVIGQLSQFPVYLLIIQLRRSGVWMVSTDSIYPCGCSIILRPEKDR